jgi:hypothetical protein
MAGILLDRHEFIGAFQAFASRDSCLFLIELVLAVCSVKLMPFLRGCKGLILEMAWSEMLL